MDAGGRRRRRRSRSRSRSRSPRRSRSRSRRRRSRGQHSRHEVRNIHFVYGRTLGRKLLKHVQRSEFKVEFHAYFGPHRDFHDKCVAEFTSLQGGGWFGDAADWAKQKVKHAWTWASAKTAGVAQKLHHFKKHAPAHIQKAAVNLKKATFAAGRFVVDHSVGLARKILQHLGSVKMLVLRTHSIQALVGVVRDIWGALRKLSNKARFLLTMRSSTQHAMAAQGVRGGAAAPPPPPPPLAAGFGVFAPLFAASTAAGLTGMISRNLTYFSSTPAAATTSAVKEVLRAATQPASAPLQWNAVGAAKLASQASSSGVASRVASGTMSATAWGLLSAAAAVQGGMYGAEFVRMCLDASVGKSLSARMKHLVQFLGGLGIMGCMFSTGLITLGGLPIMVCTAIAYGAMYAYKIGEIDVASAVWSVVKAAVQSFLALLRAIVDVGVRAMASVTSSVGRVAMIHTNAATRAAEAVASVPSRVHRVATRHKHIDYGKPRQWHRMSKIINIAGVGKVEIDTIDINESTIRQWLRGSGRDTW